MATYDYAIDIWSATCILAELISLRTLFKGKSEGDQFITIMFTLGGLTASE